VLSFSQVFVRKSCVTKIICDQITLHYISKFSVPMHTTDM